MIHHLTGDILLSKAEAIAHGVAPNDPFSSGLSLSLREHCPAMYKDFRHYCQTKHPKPGEVWVWGGAEGARIVNLFTQEPAPDHNAKPGKATIEHVNHALRELRRLAEAEKFSKPGPAAPRHRTWAACPGRRSAPRSRSIWATCRFRSTYTTFQKGMAASEPA